MEFWVPIGVLELCIFSQYPNFFLPLFQTKARVKQFKLWTWILFEFLNFKISGKGQNLFFNHHNLNGGQFGFSCCFRCTPWQQEGTEGENRWKVQQHHCWGSWLCLHSLFPDLGFENQSCKAALKPDVAWNFFPNGSEISEFGPCIPNLQSHSQHDLSDTGP